MKAGTGYRSPRSKGRKNLAACFPVMLKKYYQFYPIRVIKLIRKKIRLFA